jgi:DNA-binding NarL/FixJ family response regulator
MNARTNTTGHGANMTRRQKTIRVLICNRYTLFREGIKALTEGTPIRIVGEAANAEQALHLLQQLHPDVVLLDAAEPDASGSDATRRIKALDPHVEVLIVSLYDDEPLISGCMDAGAAGWIRKNDQSWRLRQAIHTAGRRSHRAA